MSAVVGTRPYFVTIPSVSKMGSPVTVCREYTRFHTMVVIQDGYAVFRIHVRIGFVVQTTSPKKCCWVLIQRLGKERHRLLPTRRTRIHAEKEFAAEGDRSQKSPTSPAIPAKAPPHRREILTYLQQSVRPGSAQGDLAHTSGDQRKTAVTARATYIRVKAAPSRPGPACTNMGDERVENEEIPPLFVACLNTSVLLSCCLCLVNRALAESGNCSDVWNVWYSNAVLFVPIRQNSLLLFLSVRAELIVLHSASALAQDSATRIQTELHSCFSVMSRFV